MAVQIANPDPLSPSSSRVASPVPLAGAAAAAHNANASRPLSLADGLELYEWSESALASSESEEGAEEEVGVASREGEDEDASIGCAL